MEDKLKILEEKIHQYETLPTEMISVIIDILQTYGVDKLGLWDGRFVDKDYFDGTIWYENEDLALFGNLNPTFTSDLSQGGSENTSGDGYVFAVKINNNAIGAERLELIYTDAIYNLNVYEDKATDVVRGTMFTNEIFFRISIIGVMQAVIETIRFNIQHNIPVEKWGVAHIPTVNPYTYEYL